jgi:DNA-binding response OmpR family regulator
VQILVIGPDQVLREALADELRAEWNATRVLSVTPGRLALQLLRAHQPDAVLLATAVADAAAFEVLRDLRRLSEVPILLLARSGGDAEHLEALRLGADDYLVQPVSAAVLAARVDAVRRRGRLASFSDERPEFQSGALAVWYRHRLVTVRGAPVRLTPLEYRVLVQLIEHVGEVVPTPVLLDRVWGDEYGATTKYLKVFINRLRSKLGRAEDLPSIQTERLVGYRLVHADPSSDRRVA